MDLEYPSTSNERKRQAAMIGIYQLIRKRCPECDFKGNKRDVWMHMCSAHEILAYKIKREAMKKTLDEHMKNIEPEVDEYVPTERIKIAFKESIAVEWKGGTPLFCPHCGEEVEDLGVGYGEYYAFGPKPDRGEYLLGYDVAGCNRGILINEVAEEE